MRMRPVALFALASAASRPLQAQDPWIVYPGGGKHIVFVTGEEAYRSEESMPLMARILSRRHGFKCTVLFSIDRGNGTINPLQKDNIPGLEALDSADLMVAFLRWRELPDDQMKRIMEFTNSGRPILGVRNATHPFRFERGRESAYSGMDWRSKDPEGGWGRMVLGETWVSHYGKNLVESTRCLAQALDHPILRGVRKSFWVPDDVYGISALPADCRSILLGQPLVGWKEEDQPHPGKKPIPVAWTRPWKGSRIFTMTLGTGEIFKVEDIRRIFVNACYWLTGREAEIAESLDVGPVGAYDPGPVGAKGLRKGIKPSDPIFQ